MYWKPKWIVTASLLFLQGSQYLYNFLMIIYVLRLAPKTKNENTV